MLTGAVSRLRAPLLLCALIAAPAFAKQPLPDSELLLFLAEFADEQGEVPDPALLQHAQSELARGPAEHGSSAPQAGARADEGTEPSDTHTEGDAHPRASATNGNTARARRAEKHHD